MKALLICDFLTPDLYLSLCTQESFGMEFQEFFHPAVEIDLEAYKRRSAQLSRVSLHAPFFDLIPGSIDPGVRELTITRFNTTYQRAKQIGAKHIVFHHSFFPNAQLEKGWVERSIDTWSRFFRDKDADIECHLENTLEHDPGMLCEVLDEVNHTAFSANLDIGHAHAFSKLSPVQWIERLGKRLRYAHLHSNRGSTDDHIRLGAGSVPVQETLNKLNEYAPECVWALETRGYEEVTASLEWLTAMKFLS